MNSGNIRRKLFVACAAVAAVLIIAVAMLASRGGDNITRRETPLEPSMAGPGTTAKKPPAAAIVWHDEPRPAPTTEFQDAEGVTKTIQDFAPKVLVVNLWATWCAPCVEELPTLDALEAKLGGADFRVVAIAQDREGAKVVKPFVDAQGWKALEVYLEPQARFARDAKLRGLPTTLVIDRKGREIGRLEGTIDWAGDATVDRLKALIAEPH